MKKFIISGLLLTSICVCSYVLYIANEEKKYQYIKNYIDDNELINRAEKLDIDEYYSLVPIYNDLLYKDLRRTAEYRSADNLLIIIRGIEDTIIANEIVRGES